MAGPSERVMLERARRAAARRVRTAAVIARVNAWTLGVGAVLALLMGLVHWEGAALGVALGVSTVLEFRGARGLDRLDPRAPTGLMRNQVGLIALAWAYGSWRLAAALSGSNPVMERALEMMRTGDAEHDAAVRELLPVAAGLVYGGLAVSVTVLCGVTAWYYRSRRRWVEAARAPAEGSALTPGAGA